MSVFGPLSGDVVRLILAHLRGRDVVQLGRVSRGCAELVQDDELWRSLVCARWNVSGRASDKMRQTRSTWRAVYENWDAVLRMPTSRFSGQRTAVFARTRADGMAMWVALKHTEDCRASKGGLQLRVVVQNLGPHQATVVTDSCTVILKPDRRLKSQLLSVNAKSLVCTPLLVEPRRHAVALGAAASHTGGASFLADSSKHALRLDTNGFCVLEVTFQMPRQRMLHPEALERLLSLTLTVTSEHSPAVNDQNGAHKKATMLCANFQEHTIWEHFERLPGDFWVFVERHHSI